MANLKELQQNQLIFSIRKDGNVLGYISSKDGKFVTEGQIGDNEYETLTDLVRGLWGHDIHMDNFYY